MTQEELESILIPGAKLEAFLVDEKEWDKIIEETQKRQEATLKQKIIRKESLEQVITI